MHAKFAPMDFFAWRLSQNLDRPVIDRRIFRRKRFSMECQLIGPALRFSMLFANSWA
jgi:hypothetical protein